MTKKFNIEIVSSVLQAQGLNSQQITQALDEMLRLQQEAQQQTEGERGPRIKQKHVIIASGLPADYAPEIMSAWIMKIPEEQESSEVMADIVSAANAYNESVHDKPSMKVRNISEILEFVPAKFFKNDLHCTRVTKETVDVIAIDRPETPIVEWTMEQRQAEERAGEPENDNTNQEGNV